MFMCTSTGQLNPLRTSLVGQQSTAKCLHQCPVRGQSTPKYSNFGMSRAPIDRSNFKVQTISSAH